MPVNLLIHSEFGSDWVFRMGYSGLLLALVLQETLGILELVEALLGRLLIDHNDLLRVVREVLLQLF